MPAVPGPLETVTAATKPEETKPPIGGASASTQLTSKRDRRVSRGPGYRGQNTKPVDAIDRLKTKGRSHLPLDIKEAVVDATRFD